MTASSPNAARSAALAHLGDEPRAGVGVVVDARVGPVAVPERRGEEPALAPVDRDEREHADVEVLDELERAVEPRDALGAAVRADVRRRRLGDVQRQAHRPAPRARSSRVRCSYSSRACCGGAAEAAAVLPVGDAERVDVLAAGIERVDRQRRGRRARRSATRAAAGGEERGVGGAPERAGASARRSARSSTPCARSRRRRGGRRPCRPRAGRTGRRAGRTRSRGGRRRWSASRLKALGERGRSSRRRRRRRSAGVYGGDGVEAEPKLRPRLTTSPGCVATASLDRRELRVDGGRRPRRRRGTTWPRPA